MFIIVVFWLGNEGSPNFFFRARFTSSYSHAFLLTVSVSLSYFILAVPMRECLGEHSIVHEFPISYSDTEWYFIFSRNDMTEMVEESPVKN